MFASGDIVPINIALQVPNSDPLEMKEISYKYNKSDGKRQHKKQINFQTRYIGAHINWQEIVTGMKNKW